MNAWTFLDIKYVQLLKILKYTNPIQILIARTHIFVAFFFFAILLFLSSIYRSFPPIYLNIINYLFKIPSIQVLFLSFSSGKRDQSGTLPIVFFLLTALSALCRFCYRKKKSS